MTDIYRDFKWPEVLRELARKNTGPLCEYILKVGIDSPEERDVVVKELKKLGANRPTESRKNGISIKSLTVMYLFFKGLQSARRSSVSPYPRMSGQELERCMADYFGKSSETMKRTMTRYKISQRKQRKN